MPIRGELARGDLRALYVAWLLNVQHGLVDEDELEPPCPAGLGQLSASLEALVDFLRVDRELLAVAAEGSPRLRARATSLRDARSAISKLPAKKKDALLARIALEDPLSVRDEVLKLVVPKRRDPEPGVVTRRTVRQILEKAGWASETRER
jgi:hypothetical protein